MEKKGLSPVIATIAIILLTIAAVGFISGFVVPFVKEKLYGGTECVSYREYFKFYEDFDFNCYAVAGSERLYAFSVEASSDKKAEDEISGFVLKFSNEEKSVPLTVTADLRAGSLVGEIRMLDSSKTNIEIPFSGEVRTYVYNASEEYDKMEIYPLLKPGRVCETGDSIKIGGLCEEQLE